MHSGWFPVSSLCRFWSTTGPFRSALPQNRLRPSTASVGTRTKNGSIGEPRGHGPLEATKHARLRMTKHRSTGAEKVPACFRPPGKSCPHRMRRQRSSVSRTTVPCTVRFANGYHRSTRLRPDSNASRRLLRPGCTSSRDGWWWPIRVVPARERQPVHRSTACRPGWTRYHSSCEWAQQKLSRQSTIACPQMRILRGSSEETMGLTAVPAAIALHRRRTRRHSSGYHYVECQFPQAPTIDSETLHNPNHSVSPTAQPPVLRDRSVRPAG